MWLKGVDVEEELATKGLCRSGDRGLVYKEYWLKGVDVEEVTKRG